MNGIPTGTHTTIDGCSIRWGDCNKNKSVFILSNLANLVDTSYIIDVHVDPHLGGFYVQ